MGVISLILVEKRVYVNQIFYLTNLPFAPYIFNILWPSTRRHKSSKAMKKGSLNKIPLAQQLEKLDWVDYFFDCGIIEVRNSPEVGVSADGFSLITVQTPVDPTSASDSDSEVGSLTALTQPKIVEAVVEMKTRLSDDTTIRRAGNPGGKKAWCSRSM